MGIISIFSFNEFIALIFFCAAMSFSPGPNTMLTTAIATNEGFKRTIPFALAVPVGWLLVMLACGFGLGALVAEIPAIRLAIKILGCVYLIWLALKLCISRTLHEVNPNRLNMNFIKGVAIQFLNIKVWLLAITIMGSWIIYAEGEPSTNPDQRLMLVCAVVMFFAFISNMSYAIAGALFKAWLGTGKRLVVFNYLLAALLIATAIWTLTI